MRDLSMRRQEWIRRDLSLKLMKEFFMTEEDWKEICLTKRDSRSLRRTDLPKTDGMSLSQLSFPKSYTGTEWLLNLMMPTESIFRLSKTLFFTDKFA